MDAEAYVKMMVDQVFPAARDMYSDAPLIISQQDNAPGHAADGVVERMEAAAAKAADEAVAGGETRPPRIEIRNQPPQSPDMNVLDLCVFTILNNSFKRERPLGHLRRMDAAREQRLQQHAPGIRPATYVTDPLDLEYPAVGDASRRPS